jgi:hypothetical protein
MVFIVHIWAYFYQRCGSPFVFQEHWNLMNSQDLYTGLCSTSGIEDGSERPRVPGACLVVHLLWPSGRHVADFRILDIGCHV